ncbi:MAG: hypothetical protein WEE89_12290 [Gemmatimonadota bacterium]
MRLHPRSILLAPLAAFFLAGAHPASLKDPIGVYGVIDRVEFEPNATSPDRVQIWGVFRMARTFGVENGKIESIDLSAFHPPRRGYLYYTVNPLNEPTTRQEWANLASAAGSGREVGFGSRVPPAAQSAQYGRLPDMKVVEHWERYNGRVRLAGEAMAQPDTFPLRIR